MYEYQPAGNPFLPQHLKNTTQYAKNYNLSGYFGP